MVRALVALLVALPFALAGCVGSTQEILPESVPAGLLLKPAAVELWHNPQTTPHPAFGFPTLTQPATGESVPEAWRPIPAAELPAKITGLELLAAGADAGIESGAGMSVFGSLAVVPGYGAGTKVVDISDPTMPDVLATIEEEDGNHRNVDLIAYPDGRLVAVFATNARYLDVWDLTDPKAPTHLPKIEPETRTHKVNVVPGTPIVYNANSMGGGNTGIVAGQGTGVTEIYDLTDPANPVHVQDFANGYGCHHIYFWIDPAQEKYRAICAGVQMTQLWDIADPLNPSVIVSIPVHHGNTMLPAASRSPTMFSHFAILNYAGDVLVVGDETGGGGQPPGCDVGLQAAGRSVSGPLGNLWFYDVSDETSPKLVGTFGPSVPLVANQPDPANGPGAAFFSCTAHHGRLVPDPEGRDLLAMAFYSAGVILVEFSDPANPLAIDQFAEGTNVWEVQYYNGYLFTGDLNRGMDVLGFV